ncbi:ABC transporter permease [Gordonia sp. zg691]|uniref:ABC transporter permease n=2 Tax=Gordonia jinghuaiqii TaxID=2758710 RepID=A0A7D7M1Q4_9ACTN|nr:ABC transporter permease [Gordonia jinghuaiqii]MBD0860961.1 ABC transporter permease [Gordonia jinghuaiqii]MCR5979480.1 ABC transporter [Gordonia jinghuaiqii]QMT03996.1 ABC transporter permease [Gordonia jinghuaiqii]
MTSVDPDLSHSGTVYRVSAFRQWQALTVRGLSGMVRGGEIIFAFVSPVFLAVCFYLPLRSIMNSAPGMDYAQFLMPIIALQSVGFMASAAAMRSSFDGVKGINTRFRTMPMPTSVPMLARLSTNCALLVISLVCATIASLAIGWRAEGGFWGTFGLFAVAFAVGIIVAILADAIGLLASSPEATSQALSLPILILGMVSTGFVPESQFPEWIQPFVRNQPISQFATSMRALNDGSATFDILLPTLLWCVGLFIFAGVLMFLGLRKAQK